jgi:hypothetical protein
MAPGPVGNGPQQIALAIGDIQHRKFRAFGIMPGGAPQEIQHRTMRQREAVQGRKIGQAALIDGRLQARRIHCFRQTAADRKIQSQPAIVNRNVSATTPGPKASPSPRLPFSAVSSMRFSTNMMVAEDMLPHAASTDLETSSADLSRK